MNWNCVNYCDRFENVSRPLNHNHPKQMVSELWQNDHHRTRSKQDKNNVVKPNGGSFIYLLVLTLELNGFIFHLAHKPYRIAFYTLRWKSFAAPKRRTTSYVYDNQINRLINRRIQNSKSGNYMGRKKSPPKKCGLSKFKICQTISKAKSCLKAKPLIWLHAAGYWEDGEQKKHIQNSKVPN